MGAVYGVGQIAPNSYGLIDSSHAFGFDDLSGYGATELDGWSEFTSGYGITDIDGW